MAVAIPLSNIPKECQVELAALNTFTPEKTYSKVSDYGDEVVESFSVFRTVTIDEVKYTLMPYYITYMYIDQHPEIIPDVNTYYRKGCSYQFTGSLRHYQQAAVDKAREDLDNYGTTTISMHAGAGKTVTAMAVFGGYEGVVAFVMHMEPLTVQWYETATNFTNAKVHIFGEKNNKYSLEEANVWIVMEKRIHKLVTMGVADWVRMLVVDEAHHFCTPSRAQALLGFRPEYLMMVTATPIRPDGLHQVMYAFAGTHQIIRPYQVTFDVHRICTGLIPVKEPNANGTLNFAVFTQSLMYNEVRNIYITNLVEMNRSRKILILTKEKEHVDLLANMIKSRKISVATMRGKDKNYVDKSVLIGTVSKIGCGFDEATFATCYNNKRLDMLIFLATYKNAATIEQSVGRVLRSENPVIIYFNDQDGICDNHWRVFRDWSEANGGNCRSYSVDLMEAEGNLRAYYASPIPKVRIARPGIVLWNEKYNTPFEELSEQRRGKKKKKLVNANQYQV